METSSGPPARQLPLCREQAKLTYNGAVFDVKKEISGKWASTCGPLPHD